MRLALAAAAFLATGLESDFPENHRAIAWAACVVLAGGAVTLFSRVAATWHRFSASAPTFCRPRSATCRTEGLAIPPPPTGPPDIEGLTAVAGEYGIEILGPPGIPFLSTGRSTGERE